MPTLTSEVIADAMAAARRIVEACDLAIECGGTPALAGSVVAVIDHEGRDIAAARHELARRIGWLGGNQETAATDRSGQERTRSTASTGSKPASHGGRCRKECNGC